MILGLKDKKCNWIEKLLKRNNEKFIDLANDNLLILSDDKKMSFNNLFLGILSSTLKTVLITNETTLNELNKFENIKNQQTKLNNKINICLNNIDFKKYGVNSINKILSSLEITNEMLLKSSLISIIYDSKIKNSEIFENNIYSPFINYFLWYLSQLQNKKILVAIDNFYHENFMNGINVLKDYNFKFIYSLNYNNFLELQQYSFLELFNLISFKDEINYDLCLIKLGIKNFKIIKNNLNDEFYVFNKRDNSCFLLKEFPFLKLYK